MSQESLLWTAATEAAGRIGRVIAEVLGVLGQAGVEATLVEGSALSAELSASDDLVRRFASRASVAVAPDCLERAEQALVKAGWQRAAPQGDLHLLLAAARHGRHLVFALLDEDADGQAPRTALHPAHPEAVRRRHERLSRWRMSVRMTLSRQHSQQDDADITIVETFELGLVESGTPKGAGTVSP